MLLTRYAGSGFRALILIVGPEMMPIVELALLALMDLKYEVNTNTKQRKINVKQINKLAIKEIKSQKS